MNTFTLEGQKREKFGTTASRTLRKAGSVPCVLYGGKENIHFSVTQMAVRDLVYSPKFYKVNLTVDGVSKEAILKDLQFNPVNDRLEHLDFLELDSSRPIIVELPIEFTGVSPGVKEGGKLIPKLRRIKVKALPQNLVDKVEISIDDLDLGKSVKVEVIDLPNIEVLTTKNIPIASVEVPRVMRSEQSAAAAEGDAPAAEGDAPKEGDAPAKEG